MLPHILNYDNGWWVERQNTPSAIALRSTEDRIKMQQERHLEAVGLTHCRKVLNICATTSKTAGRTDSDKLKLALFPQEIELPDTATTTAAQDAFGHMIMCAAEIAEDAEVTEALLTLGLQAMPTQGAEITTAVAKRKRDGYDTAAVDNAGRLIRRKLFTV